MAAPLVLSVQDACVRYNDKVIFENLTFNIHKGNKIALVGNNGAGKTTLMHVITAERELDEGQRWQEIGASFGYLHQDVVVIPGQKVFDYILGQIKSEDQEAHKYKVDVIASALHLDTSIHMDLLSGGQLRRASLARALVESPDILLLDEPTNHLDLEAIEWLEEYLKDFNGTLVCVSHDRTFLANVTNRIFWLDRGSIRVCPKGFGDFEEWSTLLLEQEERELKNRKQGLTQEVSWAARSPQGRRKRNVRRLEQMKIARDKLRNDLSSYNRVVSKISLKPSKDMAVSSRIVAEFYNVDKSFEKDGEAVVILEHFNMRIMRGDRIGILGKNGSGKTSFLRLLIGELEPDKGSVKRSKTAEISYFDQKRSDLNPKDSLWKTLCGGDGEYIDVMGKSRHVCGYLKDFLFDPTEAHNLVGTLSGGEKNRLMLAKILANPGNFLILDEPTNDLDMDTLDMLEEILANYQGTLFIVSHDRDFLDQTVTKILAFNGSGDVKGYIGGYSDYLEARHNSEEQQNSSTALDLSTPSTKTDHRSEHKRAAKKMSYKLEYELKKLPIKIEALTQEIQQLNETLTDTDLYSRDKDEFNRIVKRLEDRKSRLEVSEQRWLELEEMKENLSNTN